MDATTRLHWVCAEKMAADCFTKAMRAGALDVVMEGRWMDLATEKHNRYEIGSCHVSHVPVDSSIHPLVHPLAHATFSAQRGGSS